MRVIGMDIHRVFAGAVASLDGKATRLGRVGMRRDRLEESARTALTHDDHVVVEATGNAAAVAEVLAPHVGRVVIANPKQVRLIAHAEIKTDGIDAAVLAKLYASGFLPEVWVPDERTGALRRQVSRRGQLVRQRTRLKNIVQSILHAHLVPPCPHADLFGRSGRAWLARQALPGDERLAVERHVEALDRLLEDLRAVERDIARHGLEDEGVRRLMTMPGIDMVVAVGLAAAIGDVARFASAEKLVAYLGLNPSVRQSGEGPVRHGRIAKQGRGPAIAALTRSLLLRVAAPRLSPLRDARDAVPPDADPEFLSLLRHRTAGAAEAAGDHARRVARFREPPELFRLLRRPRLAGVGVFREGHARNVGLTPGRSNHGTIGRPPHETREVRVLHKTGRVRGPGADRPARVRRWRTGGAGCTAARRSDPARAAGLERCRGATGGRRPERRQGRRCRR